MFNFDLFSYYQWNKLSHAHLKGFPGLLFGTTLCLAIPLYIATIVIILRDKKSIIEIPFAKLFALFKKEPETKKEENTPEEQEDNTILTECFPSDLPPELRIPFLRAKQHISIQQNKTSIFNKQNSFNNKQNTPSPSIEESIPLPTDFDIEEPESVVPNFTDINFDIPNNNEINNSMIEFLNQQKIPYETIDDFIITDAMVIYTHSDKDFWDIDENNWFATGKQKESPIKTLLLISKQENLIPAIYLESTNIMNLEDNIKTWGNNGITIIKDTKEIINIHKQ